MTEAPLAPDGDNPLSMTFAQIHGDILSLRAIAHVLIGAHPNPGHLAKSLQSELERLHEHWESFPDPARYQAEMRLEEIIGLLQTKARDTQR